MLSKCSIFLIEENGICPRAKEVLYQIKLLKRQKKVSIKEKVALKTKDAAEKHTEAFGRLYSEIENSSLIYDWKPLSSDC